PATPPLLIQRDRRGIGTSRGGGTRLNPMPDHLAVLEPAPKGTLLVGQFEADCIAAAVYRRGPPCNPRRPGAGAIFEDQRALVFVAAVPPNELWDDQLSGAGRSIRTQGPAC